MARIKQIRLRASNDGAAIRKQAGMPITALWWETNGSVIFVPRDGYSTSANNADALQCKLAAKFPGCIVDTVSCEVMPGNYKVRVKIPA